MPWRKAAYVWINHPKKRRVVVGRYGFAWWHKSKVFLVLFPKPTNSLAASFYEFKDWDEARIYEKETTRTSDVLTFVRFGLYPS